MGQAEPWILSRYDCACFSHCCTTRGPIKMPCQTFSSTPTPFSNLSYKARGQQLPSTPPSNPLPHSGDGKQWPFSEREHKVTLARRAGENFKAEISTAMAFLCRICIFGGCFVRLQVPWVNGCLCGAKERMKLRGETGGEINRRHGYRHRKWERWKGEENERNVGRKWSLSGGDKEGEGVNRKSGEGGFIGSLVG